MICSLRQSSQSTKTNRDGRERQPMRRLKIRFSLALIALLALFALIQMGGVSAAGEVKRANCPQKPSAVVIRALQFSGAPRNYAFMVTNNSTRPIVSLDIGTGLFGRDWYRFIELSERSRPTSVGSPSGWYGGSLLVRDPRQPGSESRTLVVYFWGHNQNIPFESRVWIQPGQSLSGFSVQLPASETPIEGQIPPAAHPDLTNVPFNAHTFGGGCPEVGMVEAD